MALTCSDILTQTPQGLYCPLGDFHLDPLRPVPRALVTHGHSDHARAGHGAVMATAETLAIMAVRYGADFAGTTQAAGLGETMRLGDAAVRFVPAGHVLGSAQIVIEAGGCRVVVSGDYKRRPDPTCAPFECVPCDVFITEATFGLPVFRHPDPRAEVDKLLELGALVSRARAPRRRLCARQGAAPHGAHPRGRLREPIYIHGALERLTDFYRAQRHRSRRHPARRRRRARQARRRDRAVPALRHPGGVVAPLPRSGHGLASGWMRVRARGRQQGVELPLVISDHCDWDELCHTILETGAGEVWVTHGQEDALVHWCISRGIRARPLHMLGYGDEEGEAGAPSRALRRDRARGSATLGEAALHDRSPELGPEFDIKTRKSETSDCAPALDPRVGAEGGFHEGEGAA